MKLKILLLFIVIVNMVYAQEPYRNLLITEARMIYGDGPDNYIEVTNMGDSDIDLGEIKFCLGRGPINNPWTDTWYSWRGWEFMIPEEVQKILKPGESYVITEAYDFLPRMNKMRIVGYEGTDRVKETGIYQYADFLIHLYEKNSSEEALYPNVKDSVTVDKDSLYFPSEGSNLMTRLHSINNGIFIQHHFMEGDSAVIDQVGNSFEKNGKNDKTPDAVAGVENATSVALLVRQSDIKQGNLDFDNARGIGLEDSEWMAVAYPEGADNYRDTWWSVGNHGDFVLDANTLESDVIGVDFAGKTLTVPWGIRRLDDIMRNMKYTPGVAWIYRLNESAEDSLMRSAQTGDKLTVYVFGETLHNATFDITVEDPAPGNNIVVPIDHRNMAGGAITNNAQSGILNWPRVTKHDNGIDTITGGGYGLPNALRVDSLLKYLEKAPNASWEIVREDGVPRPDLRNGDKLRVTAQNGDVKEYFLELQSYSPDDNADLASITWPDISLSEVYKVLNNWQGDTIPNFNPVTTNYRVQLPYDFEGIPALVAKTVDLNASFTVKRATNLEGSVEERTISFEVTAENDSVKKVYNVELVKDINPTNLLAHHAEPFLSELIFSVGVKGNIYAEICNPGNQPLDLSDYMICATNDALPVDAIIDFSDVGNWIDRYRKYVPGYKWVSEMDWAITPGILIQDLNVPTIVQPGDVFCLGKIVGDDHVLEDMEWNIPLELDVQFSDSVVGLHDTYINPWNEAVGGTPVPQSFRENFYIFKILNDSIKQGLKPANDPTDFELIEAWGMANGDKWIIGGNTATIYLNAKRKAEINIPNPENQVSFGTNMDDTEWIPVNSAYLSSLGYGEPELHYMMESDLGQHYFDNPTHYISTVTSSVYTVSKGYSWNENIKGVITGTTVADFMGNVVKADERQMLKVRSIEDGSELAMDALVSINDTLVVMSADSTNTTKYLLIVSEEGFSSDAVLTSEIYEIEITAEPKSAGDEEAGSGTVSAMEYGTTLQTLLNNITVPPGASLTIIDEKGLYVPLKRLNFDTTYVDVTVSHNIFLEVVAENGVTTIVYQLQPEVSQSTAFVLSDVYEVSQNDLLIDFVPRGTSAQVFISNLTPSLGATMLLVDKMGYERTEGQIVQDDRLIVTSPNGMVTKVYYLSMLATEYTQSTMYLAYCTSNLYAIDQVNYVVNNVDSTILISDFLSQITPSMGATAMVVDSNGNEKTSGDIDGGDMLKVTSADGTVTAMYTFGVLTGIEPSQWNQIQLYPNPTNSKINISGLESGSRIQVYNALGVKVLDVNSEDQRETISLDGKPSGLYVIIISNKNELLGRYKAVKK